MERNDHDLGAFIRGASQLLPTVLITSVIVGCGPISISPGSAGQGTGVIVAAINLEGGGNRYGESEQVTAERYFRIARQYFMSAEGLWNLIGLTELRYERKQATPLSHVVLDSVEFDCGPRSGNVMGYGADCFGIHTLATEKKTDRALGYNANLAMELIPGSFRNSFIGQQHSTIIHRTVMGARFRIKGDGSVVPFYVVHISATTDESRVDEELHDLIDKIRSWYVVGDMPPVVVGDFNCANWTSALQERVLNEFADVTAGINEVMRIFISRPQIYPSASRIWRRPQVGEARLVDLGSSPNPCKDGPYTDHCAVAATLRVDASGTSGRNWPRPAPTAGCPRTVG